MTGSWIRSTCALIALSACTDAVQPQPELDVQLDPEVESRVLARLETADGARVTFHDESEGGALAIGVEITSSTTTPATDRVLAQDPTALELYLAISPVAKPPQLLVRDHEFARGDEPRKLAIVMGTAEAVDPFNCDNVNAWEIAFESWAPALDGGYFSANWEDGVTTGYVGYAPTFYFDVCRPTDTEPTDPYLTAVERRTNAASAWVVANTELDGLDWQDRRWRYRRTSSVCTGYQWRLLVNSWYGKYRRAARWADEDSCGFEIGQ